MVERHSIDFDRDASFNVLSNSEERTITLQFERHSGGRESLSPAAGSLLTAIRGRFGAGLLGRLTRTLRRQTTPFRLARHTRPHSEHSDVVCFLLNVREECRMDSALATLFEFLRAQPGYRHTFGDSLDLNEEGPRPPSTARTTASVAAHHTLEELLRRRQVR